MRLALACAALAALVTLPLGADAEETMVHVGHNRLDPAEVSIPAGDAVIFHNMDEMPGGHTIVADDGSFSSPPLAKDEKWSHTFAEPGAYAYHIKEHPDAKGKVVVEAK
jgi:plastocyanin